MLMMSASKALPQVKTPCEGVCQCINSDTSRLLTCDFAVLSGFLIGRNLDDVQADLTNHFEVGDFRLLSLAIISV